MKDNEQEGKKEWGGGRKRKIRKCRMRSKRKSRKRRKNSSRRRIRSM